MRWLSVYGVLLMCFAFLPVLCIVVASFTQGDHIIFPPLGFSLRWYEAFFSNADFMSSFWLSLRIALTTSVITTTLAVAAVLGMIRRESRVASVSEFLFMAPVSIPGVALGIGFLIYFSSIGLNGSTMAITVAHCVITFPLVYRVVRSNFTGYNWNLERAARNLGAGSFQTFRHVTLPLIAPGVLGGALLSFIFSFDDVVVALLLSGPQATTLPVRIFNYLDQSPGPIVMAAGSMLVFFAVILMFVLSRVINVGGAFGVGEIARGN